MCMNFHVINIYLFIDKDIPALHFDVLCWVFQNIQLKYSLINLTYTHIWLLCVHFRGITYNTVGTLTKYKFYLGIQTLHTHPDIYLGNLYNFIQPTPVLRKAVGDKKRAMTQSSMFCPVSTC